MPKAEIENSEKPETTEILDKKLQEPALSWNWDSCSKP